MKDCTREEAFRCLTDAGCDRAVIDRYLALCSAGDEEAGLRVLKCHRCELIEKMHGDQRQIDCLDYFIHKFCGRE